MKKSNSSTIKFSEKKGKFSTKEYKYSSNTSNSSIKAFSIIDSNRKSRIEAYK